MEGSRHHSFPPALTFTVTLTRTSSQPVTVHDGTVEAGEDYEAASGALVFAPGETTKAITTCVLGDEEEKETFFVEFWQAEGAILWGDLGVGAIFDGD